MDQNISAQDRKQIVSDFLQRCNSYADNKLAAYKTRLEADLTGASSEELMLLTDKISHWSAYRAFNEVAIKEIADGELDDWFTS